MDPVSPPDKERNQYIQVHPERKEVKVVRGEEAKWGKNSYQWRLKQQLTFSQLVEKKERKKYKELEKKIPPKKINCLCPWSDLRNKDVWFSQYMQTWEIISPSEQNPHTQMWGRAHSCAITGPMNLIWCYGHYCRLKVKKMMSSLFLDCQDICAANCPQPRLYIKIDLKAHS